MCICLLFSKLGPYLRNLFSGSFRAGYVAWVCSCAATFSEINASNNLVCDLAVCGCMRDLRVRHFGWDSQFGGTRSRVIEWNVAQKEISSQIAILDFGSMFEFARFGWHPCFAMSSMGFSCGIRGSWIRAYALGQEEARIACNPIETSAGSGQLAKAL